MRNPIVEEVRKHRMEHTRKFRGDLSAICAPFRFLLATKSSVLFPENWSQESAPTDALRLAAELGR